MQFRVSVSERLADIKCGLSERRLLLHDFCAADNIKEVVKFEHCNVEADNWVHNRDCHGFFLLMYNRT